MKRSRTHYFLIDYENVQPKNLSTLNGHPFKILVFLGPNQRKLLAKVKSALQPLGPYADCVQVSKSGSNALDFHIAFTLGELSKADPSAIFHIISRDSGFDSLLDYLRRQRGIPAQRSKEIPELPIPRISKVVRELVSRKASKPGKERELVNTINALFQNKLKDSELKALLRKLERQGHIRIDGENITYHLPDEG